jgi:hypothetical protein
VIIAVIVRRFECRIRLWFRILGILCIVITVSILKPISVFLHAKGMMFFLRLSTKAVFCSFTCKYASFQILVISILYLIDKVHVCDYLLFFIN